MPPTDPFAGQPRTRSDPGYKLIPVAPDDAADLSHYVRALWCATGGTARVTSRDGDVADLGGLQAGLNVLGCEVRKVWATGTTATGLVGVV